MTDQLVVWIDCETTGLDPSACQILEVGLVPTVNGVVRSDLAVECQVEHPLLTYQPGRLLRMGHGLNRRPGVTLVQVADLDDWLGRAMWRVYEAVTGVEVPPDGYTLTCGGKNVGSFDSRFLGRTCPTAMRRVRHRFADVGSLMMAPTDAVLPDLAECRRRAGLDPHVAHTALADAVACAEVYAVWCQRQRATAKLAAEPAVLDRLTAALASDDIVPVEAA